MIVASSKQSSKGFRIIVKNRNGNIFNHFYNKKSDAKKAWNAFVKQVREGKIKWEENKTTL